jgi:hypothetical protein
MNSLWILLTVGVLAALAQFATRSFGRRRPPDLGFVSHEWITEHRQAR